MAKKKDIVNNKIVSKKAKPEFKPGDKPYLEYDGVTLNANVPWHEIVTEIKEKNYSLSAIAAVAGTTLSALKEVLKQNFDVLSFRAGARLITLHYQLYASCYPEG
jgi:lambda repressor-like predicted transcriptional regulator